MLPKQGLFWGVVAALTVITDVRAELRCRQPEVDAGVVHSGPVLQHRFTLVNEGSTPITIRGATVSCGCLSPHLEKMTFQPGEHGLLQVEVNTLSQPAGPNAWQVRVTYQEGSTSHELALTLRATLVREVRVEPPVLSIYTDRAIDHEIAITDLRPQPFALTAVVTSTPALGTTLLPPSRDADGHLLQKVRLHVPADLVDGRHEHALAIYTTDPGYAELKVPVTIVKRSRRAVTALPDRIHLDAIGDQPLPPRMVLIRSADDQPVIVEKVEADHPAIACRFAAGPNTDATVRIAVDRSRLPASSWRGSVRVHLVQPTAETLVIPITCNLP